MRLGIARLSPIPLGGLDLGAQFEPAVGEQITKLYQGLWSEVHGGAVRWSLGLKGVRQPILARDPARLFDERQENPKLIHMVRT